MSIPPDAASWLALVVALGALVYSVVSIGALKVKHDALESALRQLPTTRELADIREKLSALDGNQTAVLNEVHNTRVSVRRIEDYLMKSK